MQRMYKLANFGLWLLLIIFANVCCWRSPGTPKGSPATWLGRTEKENEWVECNCACYGGWLCWVKGQLDPDWLPEMQEGQTGNKTKTKPGKQQKTQVGLFSKAHWLRVSQNIFLCQKKIILLFELM